MNNAFRVPPIKQTGGMPAYQQQQSYPAPGAGVSERLSDSAAQIYQQVADQQAKGLENMGQGLEKAAKAGYDLYTDYQAGQAREAFNEYRAEEMQQQAKLSALSGKDAIDPEKGVQASIAAWQQEARERLGKKLGGMGRVMLDNAIQQHSANLTTWGMEKSQAEQRTYLNQQDEGTISLDTAAMLASPMDAKTVRNSVANIEDRYVNSLQVRNGWSDEYAKAKMDNQFEQTFSKMVQNQINNGDLEAAETLLSNYGDRLGGSRGALEGQLKAKGRELEANAQADAARARTEYATSTVNSLLTSTSGLPPEKQRDAISGEIDKEKDISMRVSMRRMADAELTFRQHQQTAATNAQAMDVAKQTQGMGPVERNQFFVDNKIPAPVIDAAQHFLNKNTTSYSVMSQAKTMYYEGKSIDEISSRLGISFSPDGWNEFKNFTQNKELQKVNTAARKRFSEMLAKSGLDPKDDDDKKKISDIQAELEEKVENKEFRSLEEEKLWLFIALARCARHGLK